ncbi:PREDICTED: stomatin-like protein 3 [Cercocebus atys]|uniref:stomatin-like protein 3 n=1 Tax=Cercocebus atys TaxID=9531 RepID=UPI0005F3B41B|nr:PREDICTED: stomatin-like protein 3 [Cercocebus atys]
MIITFPISIWMCLKIIKEYERAVVFRLGRIQADKAKGPGIILVLPCIDVFVKVDLKKKKKNIPPQEILTRDSVTTQVDGVVYYRVYSKKKKKANVNDVHQATFLLAQKKKKNVLGTQTLSQILAGREEIAHSIQTLLDDAKKKKKIRVARVEIKDVRIPVKKKKNMAAEAEATREARAKVLAAEGEMNASKKKKKASMVLAESPIALQLRYLQTLSTVATEKNSTIVFPLQKKKKEGIGGVSYDNHKKVQSELPGVKKWGGLVPVVTMFPTLFWQFHVVAEHELPGCDCWAGWCSWALTPLKSPPIAALSILWLFSDTRLCMQAGP